MHPTTALLIAHERRRDLLRTAAARPAPARRPPRRLVRALVRPATAPTRTA
jgi:hypothetical protein